MIIAERRPVVGYEGLYEVSRDGEVFRVAKCSNTWAGRKLKPVLGNHGYLYVNLYRDGVRKAHTVHRIVAQAFLANPDNLPQVNHINGIKTDNRADNLEWCDASHDLIHSYRVLGRIHPMKGKRNPNAGIAKRPVRGTNIKTGEVVEMESIHAAGRFVNVGATHICSACRGKQKTSYGWRWEYI